MFQNPNLEEKCFIWLGREPSLGEVSSHPECVARRGQVVHGLPGPAGEEPAAPPGQVAGHHCQVPGGGQTVGAGDLRTAGPCRVPEVHVKCWAHALKWSRLVETIAFSLTRVICKSFQKVSNVLSPCQSGGIINLQYWQIVLSAPAPHRGQGGNIFLLDQIMSGVGPVSHYCIVFLAGGNNLHQPPRQGTQWGGEESYIGQRLLYRVTKSHQWSNTWPILSIELINWIHIWRKCSLLEGNPNLLWGQSHVVCYLCLLLLLLVHTQAEVQSKRVKDLHLQEGSNTAVRRLDSSEQFLYNEASGDGMVLSPVFSRLYRLYKYDIELFNLWLGSANFLVSFSMIFPTRLLLMFSVQQSSMSIDWERTGSPASCLKTSARVTSPFPPWANSGQWWLTLSW